MDSSGLAGGEHCEDAMVAGAASSAGGGIAGADWRRARLDGQRELAFSFCIRRARTHVCGADGHLPDGGDSREDALEWAKPMQHDSQDGSLEGYRVSVGTAGTGSP